MFVTTKLGMAAATGVLSLAVTGAAAFAAFQPDTTQTLTRGTEVGAAPAQAEREGPKEAARDKIKDVLDKLVAGGVLTQTQEDKIVAALKDAREDHDKDARGLKLALGDLMKVSADYLGLSREDLAEKLKSGMSLGQIADATPGHSRAALITFDVAKVSLQIDKLVADGKLTAERAADIKAKLVEHVTKFVDHKVEHKAKVEKRDRGQDRGKGQKPAESPKPTT